MEALYLFLAVLFVLANGYFVAAEFAIVKVRPTQLAELARHGNHAARTALSLTKSLDAYLSATQLGITLASLALGWIGEPAFARLIEPALSRIGMGDPATVHSIAAALAFAIISTLHIVIGELAPKSIAIQKPVKTSLWIAYLLRIFYLLMFPAIWFLNGVSNRLLRAFHVSPASENEAVHSTEELRMIMTTSRRAGLLSTPKQEILEGAFEFSERLARHIMVPRTDVQVLSTLNSIEENLEVIRQTRHTRYPLCDGSLDQTIGMIHVKDLFLAQLRGPGRPLDDLKRDILFVPETATVETVLNLFRESRKHMAVVLDEYGGASGIVTMENVTEELVGQIQDEFDRERAEVEPLPDGSYRVRGDYLIIDLASRLDVDLGNPAEETIGGYVAAQIGREVLIGDRVALGPLDLEIIDGERFRVQWLMVRVRGKDYLRSGAES